MPEIWTGSLTFEVLSPRAHACLGVVQLVVRANEVAVYYADRSMAVLDRMQLRQWLRDAGAPFRVGDITLTSTGRTLMLALDQAPPMPVPVKVAAQLKALA